MLEGLFAEGLDCNRAEKSDLYDTKVEGLQKCRIPYLNGGLFERDYLDELAVRFPAEYFDSLLTMLSLYNFTIDENDPNDAEVGVDPEMLGRIFENLLEDNKDKGAFYTPKEIVQYMCRESLIAYLQTDQNEEDKENIRKFVTTHDAELLGDLKADIEQKLLDVKICDPAIGSGAFPMGLLRELFFCRSAIEPNIIENAANIKRYIIQNNIYGVDIERGAVDIARLRFWLALIVDEKTPEALPNLDFKIMQGNSLLESYEGIDLSKLATMSDLQIYEPQRNLFGELEEQQIKKIFTQTDKLKEFQTNLKRYFEVTAHDERALLRQSFDDYVRHTIIYTLDTYKRGEEKKVEQILLSTPLTDKQKKTIAEAEKNIEHYKNVIVSVQNMELPNSQFFLWHTWFHDVFSRPSKEGFDIVIGNPPFIQLQNNGGELAKLYKDCGYSSFASTGDIYCLFYERGWQLLKKDGHLCYISSNKWMRSGYGEKTREFFTNKTNPMLLIDFAGVKIFESATVDTNILLFSKSSNQHKTVCAVTNKQNKDSVKNLSDFVQQQNSVCDFGSSDSWVVLSPIEQSIKKKIEAVGTPLRDWNINIYRGVLTGCNEAFIIDTEKRDEILANCQTDDERTRTAELIRPILRGRDIKRYGYVDNGLFLINTHNGIRNKLPRIDINDYPVVKAYLDQYWDRISTRADKGDTPYNLRNCAYLEDFSKPKIIWKRIGSILRFSYDSKGCLGLDSTCFATGQHIEYLCCVLNSLMGHYLLKDSPKTGTGDLLVSVQAIEPACIPYNSQYDERLSSLLTAQITNSSNVIEKEINDIVFTIYSLSPIEREYVTQFVKQSQQSQ